jgi:hypothetical protein
MIRLIMSTSSVYWRVQEVSRFHNAILIACPYDRLQLSAQEVDTLVYVFRTTAERKLRDRVQLILMAHRGQRHRSIAQDLGMTPRSVQRWLNA